MVVDPKLRNQAAQRDDPPRCGNCEQMARRIKHLEEQFEEAHRRHVACLKQLSTESGGE